MRKAGSLSQEQPQQLLAASEQPVQTTSGSITNIAPGAAATINCALCDASFAPAPEREDDWNANAPELEAAFMRVCHFCFRCRRAACPECWDPVHRVCAQCVAEAGLTFRAEPLPLADMIFPPLSSDRQTRDESASLFVCIRRGRYQSAGMADPGTGHVRQNDAAPLRQGTVSKPEITDGERAVQLSQPAVVAPAKKAAQIMEQAEHEPARKSAFKIVERILTIIALVVLLVVIILVALAEVSGRANNEIARLLQIDIRAEVAYLIALVKQIHW